MADAPIALTALWPAGLYRPCDIQLLIEIRGVIYTFVQFTTKNVKWIKWSTPKKIDAITTVGLLHKYG